MLGFKLNHVSKRHTSPQQNTKKRSSCAYFLGRNVRTPVYFYEMITAWMNNQTRCFMWHVITHPCPNPDAGVANLCKRGSSVSNTTLYQ